MTNQGSREVSKLRKIVLAVVGALCVGVLLIFGYLLLIAYYLAHEGAASQFYKVAYVVVDQAYRVERGIGLSFAEQYDSEIEVTPKIRYIDVPDCEITVLFPEPRDPIHSPQVRLSAVRKGWETTYKGNYTMWAFYQGEPIEFSKYFDEVDSYGIAAFAASEERPNIDRNFVTKYLEQVNSKTISVDHVVCEGFTVSTIVARANK